MSEKDPVFEGTLTLGALMKGGLEERFAKAVQAAAANIDDPNTPPKKARKITVEVTLEPTETRSAIMISAEVRTSLPGHTPMRSVALMGQDPRTKRFIVKEHSAQGELGLVPVSPAEGGGSPQGN